MTVENMTMQYRMPFTTKWFATGYTEDEMKDFTKMYSDQCNTLLRECDVVDGIITGISNRDVIVSVGYKSDGLVSISELRDIPEINIGDKIEVYVEALEDSKGQLVLSRKKAKLIKTWDRIKRSEVDLTPLEGLVKRRTKGGLILDINGIEAFLPGSQIEYKQVTDFDSYLGKIIDVGVVKINETNFNIVVSRTALIKRGLDSQKAIIIGNLENGQILEGIAKNMAAFGVFVDLGGIDGLLHVTDISWKRISHPSEVIELGQKIRVVVLGFDEEKKRVSLGMKQLIPNPWENLPESLQDGSVVNSKVVNVTEYGIFVEITPGVEGLIHLSEMKWSQFYGNPSSIYKLGDAVEAVIIKINRDEKKMSLGIKQLTVNPWEKDDLLITYGLGTRHKGIVRNIIPVGAFVELENGISSFLRLSELSWSKRIGHPSEILKIGEELDVNVIFIDKDNKKLYVSLKQALGNPWEIYEDFFQSESIHRGTLVKPTRKGALVLLPHDMEGFAMKKDLIKKDGTEAQIGEVLDFKVLRFEKEIRNILLSHTDTLNSNVGKGLDGEVSKNPENNAENLEV